MNWNRPRLTSFLCLALIITLFSPAPALSGPVVLSEVMADTQTGQNDYDEFLEICNTSLGPVDVAGFRVTDGDSTDELASWDTGGTGPLAAPGLVTDSTIIPVGSCAAVLDSDYPSGTQPYILLPGTVVVTVLNATIGNGLTASDPITLYDAGGTGIANVIDTYGTPVDAESPGDRDDDGLDAIPLDPPAGSSAHRIDLEVGDEESNWQVGSPTPGFRATTGIFEVAADGSTDFLTIGSAMLMAGPGSEILVHPGTYAEDVTYLNPLAIRSVEGPVLTTIQGAVVIDDVGEVPLIDGFTLYGGIAVTDATVEIRDNFLIGAGITMDRAHGLLEDNFVEEVPVGLNLDQYSSPDVIGNTFSYNNVAISCFFSSEPLIRGNLLEGSGGTGITCTAGPVIEENTITAFAIGISASSFTGLIRGNEISECTAIGIRVESTHGGWLEGNRISGNGVGLKLTGSAVGVVDNVIVENTLQGIYGEFDYVEWPEGDFYYSDFVGNTIAANQADGVYLYSTFPRVYSNVVVFNGLAGLHTFGIPPLDLNDVYGNGTTDYDGLGPGATDIQEDPLFVDPATGDYRLDAGSPCIDAGRVHGDWDDGFDGADKERDVDGDGDGVFTPDMGALEYAGGCADGDDDRFYPDACGGHDCDDADPEISPLGVEVCDGIDNDCSGLPDDGDIQDLDGDGYLSDCAGTGGSDCDDSDPEVHPGVIEDCFDGIDNDCNGYVDCQAFTVKPDGTGDFTTIQEAIVTVGSGDTIEVHPGTYSEEIWFDGKAVHVVAVEGPENTLIHGATVHFENSEGSGSVLEGFTVTGAEDGLEIRGSSPTILGNTIRDNSGFGIYCVSYCFATLEGNRLARNGNDGIFVTGDSGGVVRNNLVHDNADEGIAILWRSSPTVVNNTVVRNATSGIVMRRSSSPVVANNIVAMNPGNGLYNPAHQEPGDPALSHNDVWGNGADYVDMLPGATDFSADPLFVDAAGDDFHLTAGSPCRNAGDNGAPELPETDVDGEARIAESVIDVGADEFTPGTVTTTTLPPTTTTITPTTTTTTTSTTTTTTLPGLYAPGDMLIDEVLYDPDGTDEGWEYVILYNATGEEIDLAGWEIQWGGSDFTYGTLDLTGYSVPALSTLLLGEALVPGADWVVNFEPDIQNGGAASDGVRIVAPGAAVIDTLIYDSPNTNGLPGDDGLVPYPDEMCAPDATSGKILARDAGHADTDDCSADFTVVPPTWCDADGDGYYDETCGGKDCDDSDPAVNPDAGEVCDNGIDDDCDGLVDGDDPDCLVVFTLDVDAAYVFGYLSLSFTLGTPEPATWATYAVLTYPSITVIPLWTVSLPVIDPPIEIPISFPFPSMGWIGIWTGLFTAEGAQADDLDWADTGIKG